MAVVFTENMDKLDLSDTPGSLKKIESYIRYMQERVEFSTKNVTRSVSEAGVSSAQMYEAVITLGNALSALQSVVNGMAGQIADTNTRITTVQDELDTIETSLEGTNKTVSAMNAEIASIKETVNGITAKQASVENSVSALQSTVSGMQKQIGDLTTRVAALEKTEEG